MSVWWRNMKDYGDVVMWFMCTESSYDDWHNDDIYFLLFFTFWFGRQVQRLRHLKGAKCEEHHHQRPWGPAMLGTRLHVVSIVTPLSPAMVSHQPWVSTQVFLYENFVHFSTLFTCDKQIPLVRQIKKKFLLISEANADNRRGDMDRIKRTDTFAAHLCTRKPSQHRFSAS